MGETHYFWFCCRSLRRYLPCIQTIIKITFKITIYKINLKIGVASLRHQEKGLFRNNNKKKGLN